MMVPESGREGVGETSPGGVTRGAPPPSRESIAEFLTAAQKLRTEVGVRLRFLEMSERRFRRALGNVAAARGEIGELYDELRAATEPLIGQPVKGASAAPCYAGDDRPERVLSPPDGYTFFGFLRGIEAVVDPEDTSGAGAKTACLVVGAPRSGSLEEQRMLSGPTYGPRTNMARTLAPAIPKYGNLWVPVVPEPNHVWFHQHYLSDPLRALENIVEPVRRL